jgi:hypothetical protein
MEAATHVNERLAALTEAGVSIWLDQIQRGLIEKGELERLVKEETDSRRRRRLQDELDDLRARRERENRRIDAEKARAEEYKKDRVAEQRVRGGSRFNLRYAGAVPAGIRPEEVMAALNDYVDFSGRWTPSRPVGEDVGIWRGMSRDQAERLLGEPDDVSDRHEGSLTVTRVVFITDDSRVVAEFVEDVLVRYSITPRR